MAPATASISLGLLGGGRVVNYVYFVKILKTNSNLVFLRIIGDGIPVSDLRKYVVGCKIGGEHPHFNYFVYLFLAKWRKVMGNPGV